MPGPSSRPIRIGQSVAAQNAGAAARGRLEKKKTREFLYSTLQQLDEHKHRALAAILIIQYSDTPSQLIQQGLKALCKIIGNILENPAETKFRKIRLNNKVFTEQVAGLEGAREFLEGVGFQLQNAKNDAGKLEDFWIMAEEDTDTELLSRTLDELRDTTSTII